uniref:Sorting nexin/Vps5-like C-terminal domain-containing protein n=1 Tax=Brassica oleracea var. oleracea TaxID=109376 RepID=A0A0D3D7G4_BRAOL
MIMRLNAITQSLEGQMSSVTEKSAKYAQIAAEEVPKSLYCLGVRLTFRTLSYRGSYAVASKLTHNSLYHFCVFSDNIVDTSVVVNSTALNSKILLLASLVQRAALDIFVNWIALHPELQHSEDLRSFLQADEETMERFRFQETGIFKAKPADLMQMFRFRVNTIISYLAIPWVEIHNARSRHLTFSDAVLGKEKPVEETTPEYEKLKHYVFELENHLAEAQKHAYRLVKRHRELGQSLLDFGKAVKLLRACEGEPTGKAFSDIGTKSELLSIKLQKVAQQVLMSFEEPLKDYVRYVQSIKMIFSSFCLWD